MYLFKKGDNIVWHDPIEDTHKGVVTKDQLPSDKFVETKWFFEYSVEKYLYRPHLIKLDKKVNHVWVVEAFTWNKWVPLASSPTRAVARRMRTASEYKTRIKKYYSK